MLAAPLTSEAPTKTTTVKAMLDTSSTQVAGLRVTYRESTPHTIARDQHDKGEVHHDELEREAPAPAFGALAWRGHFVRRPCTVALMPGVKPG